MDLSSGNSITVWIQDLKAGNATAAEKLWQRYCRQLTRYARQKMGPNARRVADEEDMALMAFHSFCRGVADDRFPQLADRDDLWQILLMIAERKTIDHLREQFRQKRGGGNVRGESIFDTPAGDDAYRGIEQAIDNNATPDFAVTALDECRRLLEMLPDEGLRKVASWKLAGWKNREIAEELGCVTATVERKLKRIRNLWSEEV